MGKEELLNRIKAKAGEAGGASKAGTATLTKPTPAAKPAVPEDKWITRTHEVKAPRMRMFTFHYAGGSRAMYADWYKDLPDDVEVCSVQLPGRENRMEETPFRDFFPLIQSLGKAIQPYLDIPYVTFGHCMGGLTSFELIRQLRRSNQPLPQQMFISAFIGPQIKNPTSTIMRISGNTIDDFFDILGGTPDSIKENFGLMNMNRPIMEADNDLLRAYGYVEDDPLDIPISLFAASNDKLVHVHEVERWADQTTKQFELKLFPGDHFYIFSHRPWLMKALNKRLDGIKV